MIKKIGLLTICLILPHLLPRVAPGNPFHTNYVCVPHVEPAKEDLEFYVHDRGTCNKEDLFMKVEKTPAGTIFLIPAPRPIIPQQQKEFENFKKFYGLEGPK